MRRTPDVPRARPHLLLRSALTTFALLLVALPALAVAGGFLPGARPMAGFGRLLVTDLPWLALGAAVALVLSLVAIRLGGRRFTALLAATCLVVLSGAITVGVQFAALAASHSATYDILRQAQKPPPPRGPDERVVFAEVGGEALSAEIWRARDSPVAEPPNGLRPGVMFIHGGAFMHGSPGLRPHLFAWLADSGYAVADIGYRLAPPPRWQDAPADALCALGWFQSVASTYGVDPDRIVVMGDSAGGNLALLASYGPGYASATDPLEPSCDVAPEPPAGVIALYPVADLAATWHDLRAMGGETPFPEVYTGGTPSAVPDRYAAASVKRLIRPNLPPTLIYTGANDQLVRIEHLRDLASRLHEAGSEVELVEVPFADHAFDGPANGFGMQLQEGIYRNFLTRATRA